VSTARWRQKRTEPSRGCVGAEGDGRALAAMPARASRCGGRLRRGTERARPGAGGDAACRDEQTGWSEGGEEGDRGGTQRGWPGLAHLYASRASPGSVAPESVVLTRFAAWTRRPFRPALALALAAGGLAAAVPRRQTHPQLSSSSNGTGGARDGE
jgi:hypothetical protein